MVSYVDPMLFSELTLAWLEKGKSPLEQMTTEQRQVVFVALGTIVLMGIVMIFLISLSARMVRRYVKQSAGPPAGGSGPAIAGDDWARKPLIEVDDPSDEL